MRPALRAIVFAPLVSACAFAHAGTPAPVEPSSTAVQLEGCALAERNPETASVFDPACNAFMLAPARRPERVPDPLARYVILPPAAPPMPAFATAGALASSSGLVRTPERVARDARFSDAPITLPASYRALEHRLRIDASAQLMRPEPARVGVAVGAAAEYLVSPGFTLRARTQGRTAADGFALTFGAAAEVEPAPTLRLRAQTELDDSKPRWQFGARCELVPRRLDLEMVSVRQPGADPGAWSWRTQLTYRAPFLD